MSGRRGGRHGHHELLLRDIDHRRAIQRVHVDLKVFVVHKDIEGAGIVGLGRGILFLLHQFARKGLFNQLLALLYLLHGDGPYTVRRLFEAVLPLQKLLPSDRVERVDQQVVHVHGQVADLLLGFFQLGFDHLGRPAGDGLLAPGIPLEGFFLNLGVDGHGGFAVQPVAQVLDLAGDHVVALLLVVEQDVVDRLDAHDLAGGRDQRDLAQLLAHPRQFLVHLVDLVQGVHFAQLVDQVGEHAAGGLVQQHVDVDHRDLGVVQQVLVLGHHLFFQLLVDLGQQLDVEAGVAVGAQQGHHQGLDGRVRGSVGIGGHAGVDDVHPRLDGLEVAHGRHAGSKVAVQVDGYLDRRLEGLDQVVGIVGGDQTGHVLDADRVGAHGLEVLGFFDVVIDGVHIAAHARFGHGVAHATLEVLAALLDYFDRRFEIAVVVQGVEGSEDVHAVGRRPVHEGAGGVVGVVAVAHQVLGAQQH